jgi:ADP-ribose pyrophosphatase
MKKLFEKFLKREEIFEGAVLHVIKDTVELPNGKSATRELCLHVGAVCVIPLLSDGRVVMERQYRYPHGRVFFEIPAGKLNYKEEDPLEAAKRELREETGAIAESFTYLGAMVPSPAILSERIHMYLAEGLTFGETELDEDEFLDVEYVPLDELYEMVMQGKIEDAKTEIAVLKLKAILENRKKG